jgi:hypothetical protein
MNLKTHKNMLALGRLFLDQAGKTIFAVFATPIHPS